MNYNDHVTKARIFYETHIPRIDGRTGDNGLPHVFGWVMVTTMMGQN